MPAQRRPLTHGRKRAAVQKLVDYICTVKDVTDIEVLRQELADFMDVQDTFEGMQYNKVKAMEEVFGDKHRRFNMYGKLAAEAGIVRTLPFVPSACASNRGVGC